MKLNKTIFAAIAALFVLGLGPCQAEEHSTSAPETASSYSQEAETTFHGEHLEGEVSELAEEGEHEEGLSPSASIVFEIPLGSSYSIPVTNSMLTSWIVSILLIILIRLSVGNPKLIPGKAQMVVESMVGTLKDILEMIVGSKLIGKTFPVLFGFFVFILIQNWFGLIPGLGAITYEGHHVLRPGNADLNMTLGLALAHFVVWLYFVMRYAGPKVLFLDLFGNKAPKSEVPKPIYLFMFVLFAGVGVIEVISLLFRNISLPFRLFGNVYGGENLMESMTEIYAWLLPIPFYYMELLVGIVQAMVFTILVSVYIGQICNHDEGEHAH